MYFVFDAIIQQNERILIKINSLKGIIKIFQNNLKTKFTIISSIVITQFILSLSLSTVSRSVIKISKIINKPGMVDQPWWLPDNMISNCTNYSNVLVWKPTSQEGLQWNNIVQYYTKEFYLKVFNRFSLTLILRGDGENLIDFK